ncbi:MAG TPA: phosphate/phosphite/phosphonate ABC transporter substrate-binding protein [Caulobacteraceae bacterium]
MIGRRLLAALSVCALAAACGRDLGQDGAGDSGAIRFAVLSTQSTQSMSHRWTPVINDMQVSTGLKVKPFFAANSASLVEAMRNKKTDVGWFSNRSGLEAVRRAGGEVFARTTEPTGVEGDHVDLIVNAKSKLTLDRVLKCDKTLTFGMGEAQSASGALAPETYLFAPRGVRPSQCFKQVRRASHQTNLFAVAAGELDVATVPTTALRLNRQGGRREADEVREIWRSPVLPEDPIIWRKDLDPAVKEKLRQFFLTYGQGDAPLAAAQRAKLAAINIGGFKAADDTHLLPVREMEATRAWLDAQAGGDKARIEAAKRALDQITAQRQDLEARTRTPAAAQ